MITAMEAAARIFFASKHFAVAGASEAPQKFGFKIMVWYHDRALHPVPVTPSRSSIQLQDTSYDCVPSPLALADPTQTSLSIVTPSVITREILRQAHQVGVPAVWLQPGSFDDEDLEYAKKVFNAAIGGPEEAPGPEGWCVLVNGDQALDAARCSPNNHEKL